MRNDTKTNTHLRVGGCYAQGNSYISWYKVLQIDDDTAILCRPIDGWTLTVHNPVLHETPCGQRLRWDYSTGGRFIEENRAD
ncbi:MAG: hypothetical protein RSD23_03120 [Ruthenibacterium sp.]